MARKFKYHKFKQGIYKPVNSEKYTGNRKPVYRSSWELKFFRWCDSNTNVLRWSSESVIVPYVSPIDGRIHRYHVDGVVKLAGKEGPKNYLIEIKPYKQTIPPMKSNRKKKSTVLYESATYAVNRAKWDAARQYAKHKNMEFLILTEKELFA